MKLFELLRRNIFWFFDFLNGGEIRQHYQDIKDVLENPNSQTSKLRCNNYLNNILQHATETTQFYSKFKNFKNLGDFPIINKTIIKQDPDSFLSSEFKSVKLHKVTTSGSTGAPLSIYQDKGKRVRHQAESILFSELAGHPLGARLYYLRVWNEANRKTYFKRLQQNIIMQDASDLSDSSFRKFIDKLGKDNSTKSILAFSSTYEALSHFLNEITHPLPVKVNSLITMSEALPEGAKQILRAAFNCPVVSRYSNMENGFLAQQCIDENHEYHINSASFKIELLDENKDEPAISGKPGRIVITDLFNFGMPMIRYDTGDMAIISEKSACSRQGPVFTKVEGRKVDFIHDTKGNLLSPHVITNSMWKYASEIKQFQFIQNGVMDYTLKLNTYPEGFNRSLELLKDFKFYLGNDAKIKIEFVHEIPLLASGKRKKIVNNLGGQR